MMGVGLVAGAINAVLVTRLRLFAFIATLATLYIGRGVGRWVTETRAINLPDAFLALGSTSWLGLPLPVWVAAGRDRIAEFVLSSDAVRPAALCCRRECRCGAHVPV